MIDAPVCALRGVGPATERLLEALGLATVRDLLFHLPARYLDRSRVIPIAAARPGEECLVRGVLGPPSPLFTRRRGRGVTARLTDASGTIRCVWFGATSWVGRWAGREVVIAGRVSPTAPCSIVHPEIDDIGDERDPYLPVYPTTAGLSQRRLRSLIKGALGALAEPIPSLVPTELAHRCGVHALADAVRFVHEPPSLDVASAALDRVRLEALIPVYVAVARRRAAFATRAAPAMGSKVESLAAFLHRLPFGLTRSQAAALTQIRADLAQARPMHRLLQGDVGSGKTVVAACAGIVALAHGYQVAVMAPTEVLADQHARVMRPWLEGVGYGCGVVTGGTPPSERSRLLRRLAAGEPILVIGTHALLEESVHFARLGLVIVDEQHRFGLAQRSVLAAKGESPHVLVMTATPIPRSLAMTAYGHLDLSVLDEKPPGRRPVRTLWCDASRQDEVWDTLRLSVRGGTQAFVVAPLVEESSASEVRGAVELYRSLCEGALRGFRVGLVHGRMRADEKDGIIEGFRRGALQVLVCTTVVEVGLDAPGAGLLVVVGAERFGLSTLHQLRGRIGRGGQDAVCILLTGEDVTDDARERIKALLETDDGFRLAEIDLAQRGPGALLGPAQHGRIAGALCADPRLIAMAQACAQHIVTWGPPAGVDLDCLLAGLDDLVTLGAG